MKILALFFILVFPFSDYDSDEYHSKWLKKVIKQSTKHFKENTNLTPLKAENKTDKLINSAFYSIKNGEETVLGIAIISLVNGCVVGGCSTKNAQETRYEQFYILSIYNKEKELCLLSILDYPGEYGYEISAKWWLKEFLGSSLKTHVYQQNIDAISGATVSAQSLVNKINALNAFVKTMEY
jgi:hypothetical protein